LALFTSYYTIHQKGTDSTWDFTVRLRMRVLGQNLIYLKILCCKYKYCWFSEPVQTI